MNTWIYSSILAKYLALTVISNSKSIKYNFFVCDNKIFITLKGIIINIYGDHSGKQISKPG